ncbi:DUF2339 domain-containing protein [Pseudonocardia acaciae]|uniref:DUF2339 domain-containing protein n=1 Tax=Pseudonocardia acaciae TaxID=551276 RepID=UPI00048B3955|nr:DUF2339 domain-containing protein [Pseudonocardia acaciae]
MTSSEPERVARLAAELAELGRRLDWARHELLSLPIAQPPPPPPTPPVLAPPPPPAPVYPAYVPPAGLTPPADAQARGGRLIAWVGGSITLLGVVMFLALAASRGWFGVPARLVAGGVLGLALVGVGLWLYRRPGGRTGALALAATGIAALYLDVGTATARYHYLPNPAGLAVGLVIAAAGLALADRWRAQPLAAGAVIGVGALMPVLTEGDWPLLVALVLAPQLAAAPVVWRRGWSALAVVAALFPVLYGAVAVFAVALSESADRGPTLAAVIAVFVVGAVLAVPSRSATAAVFSPHAPAGLDERSSRGCVSPGAGRAVRFVAAPVPALAMATDYGGWRGALLAGLVGAVALAVAFVPVLAERLDGPGWLTGVHPAVRVSAGAAAGVAIFEATVLALGGAALTGVLLGQALVLVVVAAATGRRGPLLAGAGYGLVGLGLAAFQDAPVRALALFPAEPYLHRGEPDHRALLTGLALSVLVLALATATMLAAARLRLATADAESAWLWAPVGAIGLYGATGTVVTAALLVVPAQPGFVAGHALVTISWTLVALILLARGIERRALRVAGLVLMAVSVAKLLLFDLVALDGLARVAAFVGAGLLILAAGSHYARLVARSQQ